MTLLKNNLRVVVGGLPPHDLNPYPYARLNSRPSTFLNACLCTESLRSTAVAASSRAPSQTGTQAERGSCACTCSQQPAAAVAVVAAVVVAASAAAVSSQQCVISQQSAVSDQLTAD